ncbi:hypothetical protein C8R45DRAFT_1086428 [Mycena sanguinolenta]|nr:hypothetical protein C8R45DRAFT_1086428 [Mycena sanguinolenta]
MGAHEWTTPEQRDYLHTKLPAYKVAAATGKKTKVDAFFISLNEEFLTRWPVDPAGKSLEELGLEITAAKNKLKTWMRYRTSERGQAAGTRRRKNSLFTLLKSKQKKPRPYRAFDAYTRLYKSKVAEEVKRLEEQGGIGDSDGEGEGAGDTDEIDALRSVRMKRWRKAAATLYGREPQENMNAGRSGGSAWAECDEDLSPEDFQFAIDQLPEVVGEVLSSDGKVRTMGEHTGWHFALLGGGPMPNRSGAISTKSFCYGTTPLGADFQSCHPDFQEQVKLPFCKYLKRAFDHAARNARAMDRKEDGDEDDAGLDGLIPIDAVDDSSNKAEDTEGQSATKRLRAVTPAGVDSFAAAGKQVGETRGTDKSSGYTSAASSVNAFDLSGGSAWDDNDNDTTWFNSLLGQSTAGEEFDPSVSGPSSLGTSSSTVSSGDLFSLGDTSTYASACALNVSFGAAPTNNVDISLPDALLLCD